MIAIGRMKLRHLGFKAGYQMGRSISRVGNYNGDLGYFSQTVLL